MIQTLLALIKFMIKFAFFSSWFILNVFWLIFKNFRSKLIDLGKKKKKIWALFEQALFSRNKPTFRFNIYLSHRQFYICTRKYSPNCTIPVKNKIKLLKGGHIPLRYPHCAHQCQSQIHTSECQWRSLYLKMIMNEP